MGSTIKPSSSVDVHLNSTQRHIRLCYQIPGAKTYAEAIEPKYSDTEQKHRDYKEACYACDHAHDLIVYHNNKLDDGVRTAFERCKQHDRENPNSPVLGRIFPKRTFGEYIRNSMFEEPNKIEQLAFCFEELGEEHALFPTAEYLRNLILTARDSFTQFYEEERKESIAKAALLLSKADIRDQFETNYLDARKEFGKKMARHLFPSTYVRKPTPTEPTEGAGSPSE